jgi:hypothetical protein
MSSDIIKKVPLQWAAEAFSQISNRIEESDDIDTALVSAFDESRIDIAEALDRRRAFKNYCEMMIARCKDEKKRIQEVQSRIEDVLERFKEKTKAIIEANPSIPFVDTLGKKISVVKNGAPRLSLKLPLTASKSVANIIDAEQAEFFGVDKKYLKQVSFLVLDTEVLKADLKAGQSCDWAELEYNTQLRGL